MTRYLWAALVVGLLVALAWSMRPAPEAKEDPLHLTKSSSDKPVFLLHEIGRDHSEGIAALDVNGDGRLDATSGAYWYEAPNWTRRKLREAKVDGEFVVNCGEFAIDVDEDGDLDLVGAGWQEDGVFWFENPGQVGPQWEKHLITPSKATEGLWRADLDGDGKDEVVVVHYAPSEVFYISFAGGKPVKHIVGGKEGDGHGVGVGDIDGDGKQDIAMVRGWYRQIDAAQDQWEWRPEFQLGEAGFGIQIYDVNNDGKNDILHGRGHSYGLFWQEQTVENGQRAWKQHLIDGTHSQLHNVRLADLDDDGTPELMAGTRYRGHNGDDPGAYNPLSLDYYTIDRATATFTRYPIAYNSMAGAGTQFVVVDFDGDGDKDFLTAGKSGQYWFENLKIDNVPGKEREKDLLLNTDWPYAD